MKNIRLHHPFSNNMTAVSNYFIDYYMPQANGEYVKLYLCLLRQVADRDCTEFYLMRPESLPAWAKTHIKSTTKFCSE